MYPSIHLSSLLKSSFFKLSMREHKEQVEVFALHKVLQFSHPLSPQCASYFHQILRHCLCDFLILVPLLSLSFLSVSETKVFVTFSGFVYVSLLTYLSSLCSAALHSSDIRLNQCCHWVPCSGLVSRCICHLSVSNTQQQPCCHLH